MVMGMDHSVESEGQVDMASHGRLTFLAIKAP